MKRKLVSESALKDLINAIEAITGVGKFPPGWDWANAPLHTNNDWPLVQAAYMLRQQDNDLYADLADRAQRDFIDDK